jgi:uncharacterized membrane protein|tara:strand:+ start:498 stop:1067 length:570 start_codon:yes stop_codon:yes gene_type:complete
MNPILRVSSTLIVLLYPFLVYFGLRDFQPRALSCLLLVIVVLRFVNWKVGKIEGYQKTINLYWIAAALIAILFTFVSGSKIGLYLYPLLVNVAFFIFFYISILNPPTIIEQIARGFDTELSDIAVIYTRKATKAWCLFFLFNGSMSVISIFLSEEWWLLYNGFISYILIASMFGAEYLFRIKFMKQRNG